MAFVCGCGGTAGGGAASTRAVRGPWARVAAVRCAEKSARRGARARVCMSAGDSKDAGGGGPSVASAVKDNVPFEIRGFSLANFGIALGAGITGYSFYQFFTSNGTASVSSLGFVYGVPILLIGFALKYAELKPVTVSSTPDGRRLRDVNATEIQKKVLSDVTRHRYGDEQHLDTTLKALGLVPRGAACPELLRIVESANADGAYVMTLEFFSKETPYKMWEERVDKYERFFGPNVRASVEKVDEQRRIVALVLTSTAKSKS